MIIRKALESDSEILIQFNRAMARETESRDLSLSKADPGVRSVFQHPEYGFYLVAESEGEIIGTLLITTEWSDWRNALYWWIQSVYVRPECRGQGVYRALHDYVRSIAKSTPGVCGCRLYVEKQNTKAQEIYSHLGMHEAHYKMFEEIFETA